MGLVLLKTVDSPIEAAMVCNNLENEGIEVFKLNETFSSLVPGYYGILGSGIQLMIEEENLERATSILGDNTQKTQCPDCKSENVELSERKLKLFFTLLFAAPVGNLLNDFVCKDCGCTFKR